MNIDKAFEKWFNELKIGKYIDKIHINTKKAYTAGVDYGTRQSRIETLNNVARGIDSDDSNESFRNELRIYIDTEIKKASE